MSQVLRQIRYTNKAFWRNPASAFFTFAFPLLFLVIFTTLIGNGDVDLGNGVTGKLSTFYVSRWRVRADLSLLHQHRHQRRVRT